MVGIEKDRIIAALASGKPRIGSEIIPYGEHLLNAPIWSSADVILKLQENSIFELSTFLRQSDKALAKILKWKVKQVDEVKRRTINELDNKGDISLVDTDVIVDSDAAKRFHKKSSDKNVKDVIPRLGKALNRRWIRNYYDYLVSPVNQLKLVSGLFKKLMEAEKLSIVRNIHRTVDKGSMLDDLSDALAVISEGPGLDSFFKEDKSNEETTSSAIEPAKFLSTDTELMLIDVLPNLDEFLKLPSIKKRKIKNIYDFLVEISHPTNELDANTDTIALDLVKLFKDKLFNIVTYKMELANAKVDEPGQHWIDGNLRNSFKNSKISTLNDLLLYDDKKLSEIGYFQRLLFKETKIKLIPANKTFDIEKFKTDNTELKIKILKKSGIKTLEKFLETPSSKLFELIDVERESGKNNIIKYFELLVEESKDRITEVLTHQNELGGLDLLKILDKEFEYDLSNKEIFNTIDFLKEPLQNFNEKYHDKIIYAKTRIGKKFDGFTKTQIKLFKKLKISVLEELVFSPNVYLSMDLTEADRKTLENVIDQLMKPIHYMDPHLLSSVETLFNAGVTTIGKFLVWSTQALADILDYQAEWLNLMKENFDIKDIVKNEKKLKVKLEEHPHIFDKTEIEVASYFGFDTVAEVAQIKWGDISPQINKWNEIDKANKILLGKIDKITDIVLNEKDKKNMKKIVEDLLRKSKKDPEDKDIKLLEIVRLVSKSPDKFISMIKGKPKKQLIQDVLNEIENNNIEVVDPSSIVYRLIKLFNLINKVRSPIVYLSEFDTREIGILNKVGVQTLHQLISITKGDILEFVHVDIKNLKQKLNESTLKSIGTPLFVEVNDKKKSIIKFTKDDVEYFTNKAIDRLQAAGFDTIEKLYYNSDKRIFAVNSLSWDVIADFKKLMQSPLVLITWVKEIKIPVTDEKGKVEKGKDGKELYETKYNYESFTSTELQILKSGQNNISRVIDFLTADSDEIMKMLDWDKEMTIERQTSVVLAEIGIELADLEIFRPDHINHLEEIGIATIQDLYFTAEKETWESEQVPWTSIQTIKDILHLDLINAVEELTPEIVELLKDNAVNTIYDLYLTDDPILAQKTDLPAERFENLKTSLDVGALIQVFDKSVFFTPGLTYFQNKILHSNGYTKIIDVVLEDNKEIAKILGLQVEEIDIISEGIMRTSVQKSEDENGVSLKEIMVFSRSEIRSISKSGIFEINELDTLQEVLYQIDPSFFQGEDYLLEQVLDLQKVCKIKLEKIGDLNIHDVKLLKKYDITTIADALIVGYEDLVSDPELYEALSNVTKSVIDLRPFISIGKLDAKVAMVTGEYDGSLLNAWIDGFNGLNSRVINSLRSLMSIPITFTRFMKYYDGSMELLEDKTVGDIILEYTPDESSPLARLKNKINEQGSLIQLLKEGSSPISLLELQPVELRILLRESISTIERLLTKDPKYLSNIVGNTQKFWSGIKDIFSPDVFQARLEDIGIPFTLFGLSEKQRQIIEELDIQYLEQLLHYENLPEEISVYHHFLFASTTFLIGTPGEKELAENMGAQNILEAIQAFRVNGAINELIRETLQIAWSAYNNFSIPVSVKDADKIKVYTMQDLVDHVSRGGKTSPKMMKKVKIMNSSLLFLPLKSQTLKELINEHRCSNIIEALTSPMVFGEISKLRTKIKEEELELLDQIVVPISVFKRINKTIWNRFAETDINIQDILSSPRTIQEFKGIKLRYIQQARDELKLPINRIHLFDRQLYLDNEYASKIYYLEDLLYKLPSIFRENPEMAIKMIEELTDDITVLKPIGIPEKITHAAVSTFSQEITNFQSLYCASMVSSKLLKSIDTNSSITVREYILRSLKSISTLDGITPRERWDLWKVGVRTIADLLLSPINLGIYDFFTIKRVKYFQEVAIKSLDTEIKDSTVKIKTILSSFSDKSYYRHDFNLANLMVNEPHQLISEQIEIVPEVISKLLNTSIYVTELGNSLNFNTIKNMLTEGVYTVGDFLFYPEELELFDNSINSVDNRLKEISNKFNPSRKLIKLDDITLPDSVQNILTEEDTTVIHLLEKLYRHPNRSLKSKLLIRLQYSDFSGEQINRISNLGITTILDLLICTPLELSSTLDITEDEVVDRISSIDIRTLSSSISSAPLQIADIEEISKNSQIRLKESNYETVLDLSLDALVNLNKSDINTLHQVISILDSDISILTPMKIFTPDIFERANQLNYKYTRDIIRNYEQFDGKFKLAMKNIKLSDLIDVSSEHRKLSDLDGIVVKEEKLLNLNGIYTFNQLSTKPIEFFSNLGLNVDKYENIIQSLSYPYMNIVDLSDDIKSRAEIKGIDNVAELLSDIDFYADNITTPIKIKQEFKLTNFFRDDNFSTLLEENSINSLMKFMKSQKVKKLISEKNEAVISIVGTLNLPIDYLPGIKSKWLNTFKEAKIFRIHQYLGSDLQMLASLSETSYTSQENYINKLNLTEVLKISKLEFPVMEQDKEVFHAFGLISLNSLTYPELMINFIKSYDNLIDRVNVYLDALNTEIWKSTYYWNIHVNHQVMLANNGDKIIDLLETRNNALLKDEMVKMMTSIFHSIISGDEVELKSLSDWFSVEIINENEPMNVHEWLFVDYKDNLILKNSKLFRSPINIITGLTVKQVIKAYNNGITHISDILLLDESSLKTKLGISKAKLPTILEEIREIKLPVSKLPRIAFFNDDILNKISEQGIYSWAQIIGNIRVDELNRISGFTEKTRNTFIERVSVPIWHITEIRDLGLKRLKKIVSSGCSTILDALLIGEKIREVFEETELKILYENISVKSLNKGAKHQNNRLSISTKIKVGDIPKYNSYNITSPVEIILGTHSIAKNSPLYPGIADWIRLGEISADTLNFKEDTLANLKKAKLTTIADLIIASNDKLRNLKATNMQIKEFREKMIRRKIAKKKGVKQSKTVVDVEKKKNITKKTSKKTASKASDSKKTVAKKAASKAVNVKGKKTSSKKITGKKMTKKTTGKKSAVKKKSTKKKGSKK